MPLTTGLTVSSEKSPLEKLAVNTIRTLAMDAVQAANSGHPGTPMALAPVAYCLWQRLLRFDPEDPMSGFQLGPNMKHVRGYHSAALLLPDGSVLMGGDPNGGTTPNERYLPPYFFKPRPTMGAAPAALGNERHPSLAASPGTYVMEA